MPVTGLNETIRAFDEWQKRMKRKAELAAGDVATFLLNKSLDIVPTDLAILKPSGAATMHPESGGGFDTVSIVSFGTAYAIWAHEDLTKAHGEAYNQKYARQIAAGLTDPWTGAVYKLRRPQEQAKFLEDPFRENEVEVVNRVVAIFEKK